jgi:hypothetical protein
MRIADHFDYNAAYKIPGVPTKYELNRKEHCYDKATYRYGI